MQSNVERVLQFISISLGPVLASSAQSVMWQLRPQSGLNRDWVGFPLRGGVWADKDQIGVFGGEEEGGGVWSGSGEDRTILLLHIISARPSKQSLMVCTFLKVYMEIFSHFVSARELYQCCSLPVLSPHCCIHYKSIG